MGFTYLLLTSATLLILLEGSINWAMENKKFPLPSNCSTKCGDIKIEYPFGIGNDCSYAVGFNLTCLNDSNPARLLLGDGTIQITNFDIEEGLVYIQSPYVTLNADGQFNTTSINLKSLPFSLYHNNLYVIGCNATAIIIDIVTNGTEGACSAICSATNTSIIDQGFSFGNGYCILDWDYTRFNQDIWAIQLTKLNKDEHYMINGTATSIIAFVYDESANDDAFKSFMEDGNTTRITASLTWYINDYSTCKEALERNDTRECRSNKSICYDEVEGSTYPSETNIGYWCECSSYYVGNPYLPDGCQLGNNSKFILYSLCNIYVK